MRIGSLFAGIGGADLALESLGCETVWHAEVEPYASEVFARRFPRSMNLGDVTTITGAPAVDVLVGGFPCQDISAAGKGAGIAEGTRSGLWSEYARLIDEQRPRLVLIENVSMLLRRGLDVVLADLDRLEYAVEWDCIPAAAVGAPHLRDRIWMIAYPEDVGPLHVFGEARLEKSLATLALPPSKWPRAGRMEQGAVFLSDPVAPRKTKRLNPGSAWVGHELTRNFGWWHQATDEDPASLYPTPLARDWKETGDMSNLPENGILPRRVALIERGLWPTPKASASGPDYARMNRPRSGGDDLATAVARTVPGPLGPKWVEWLMGFPLGWTDLTAEAKTPSSWSVEPAGLPRTAEGVEKRKERLTCLGNALVPQVMRWVAERALERLS